MFCPGLGINSCAAELSDCCCLAICCSCSSISAKPVDDSDCCVFSRSRTSDAPAWLSASPASRIALAICCPVCARCVCDVASSTLRRASLIMRMERCDKRLDLVPACCNRCMVLSTPCCSALCCDRSSPGAVPRRACCSRLSCSRASCNISWIERSISPVSSFFHSPTCCSRALESSFDASSMACAACSADPSLVCCSPFCVPC